MPESPSLTASDGGAPPRRRTLRWTRPRGKGCVKSEKLVHLDPLGGWFLKRGALFKLFVSNSSKCLPRGAKVWILRLWDTVWFVQKGSQRVDNRRVYLLSFFSLALACGFICRWFEKCDCSGERLQVDFRERLRATRVSAHNTHKNTDSQPVAHC